MEHWGCREGSRSSQKASKPALTGSQAAQAAATRHGGQTALVRRFHTSEESPALAQNSPPRQTVTLVGRGEALQTLQDLLHPQEEGRLQEGGRTGAPQPHGKQQDQTPQALQWGGGGDHPGV